MDAKSYAIKVLRSKAQIDAVDIKKSLPRWIRCVHTDGHTFSFRLDHRREIKHVVKWISRAWRWSGVYELSFSGPTGERAPWDEWHEERRLTAEHAVSPDQVGFSESEQVFYDEEGRVTVSNRTWMLRYGERAAEHTRMILVTPPPFPDRLYIEQPRN